MDYINARIRFAEEEPFNAREAVEIINSWRLNPESYYQLLQTQGASVALKLFKGHSPQKEKYVFEPSDKLILSPELARKFFELESDDLDLALFETLKFLTFKDSSDDEINNFYVWPYLEQNCTRHFSADIIESLLYDWDFVFDWEFDNLGREYSILYNKLLNGGKCCDSLAVNSFNLFNYLDRDEVEVDVLAKHYCFANYTLGFENSKTDVYFRKCLVHYLGAFWNNMENIVTNIVYRRIIRSN